MMMIFFFFDKKLCKTSVTENTFNLFIFVLIKFLNMFFFLFFFSVFLKFFLFSFFLYYILFLFFVIFVFIFFFCLFFFFSTTSFSNRLLQSIHSLYFFLYSSNSSICYFFSLFLLYF